MGADQALERARLTVRTQRTIESLSRTLAFQLPGQVHEPDLLKKTRWFSL